MLFVPLSLIATAVTAALVDLWARRFNLVLFGATVLGVATAVDGGTLRDLLLGLTPVFRISDLRFLLVAVPSALMSFFVGTRMPTGNIAPLMYLDAVGLALFTLTGVQVALKAGVAPVLTIVIGCVTGTACGMIRDLLCNITPSVLRDDLRPYPCGLFDRAVEESPEVVSQGFSKLGHVFYSLQFPKLTVAHLCRHRSIEEKQT